MASTAIGVPWGAPNDDTRGTTHEDMQAINAGMYYFEMPGGLIHGCDLSTSSTNRISCSNGTVLLAKSKTAAYIVPFSKVDVNGAVRLGQQGTTYISVGMSKVSGQSNIAELITRTTVPPADELRLGRVDHPAGWQTMADCQLYTRQQRVLPAGSAGHLLGYVQDRDLTRRTTGNVEKLNTTFYNPIYQTISVSLTSTVRATADGRSHETGGSGGVKYMVYLDNQLIATWERAYNAVAETLSWSVPVRFVPPGDRTIRVVASRTISTGGSGGWHTFANNTTGHLGDYLTIFTAGQADYNEGRTDS